MKTSNTLCVVGSVILGALSCTQAMNDYIPAMDGPRPVSDFEKTFSGEFYTGYQSRYQYKNIVVSRDLNSSGLFALGGRLDMPLATWEQHVTADYAYVCDGRLNDRNVFNAGWAADREILPNLKAGAGYQMNYGGLPGFVTRARGKTPHSIAQSFDGYLTYDDPGTGYFGTFDVQGGFYGLTGWRFDIQAGKRWTGLVHQYVDVELSGGMGISTSYWGSGVDGIDQLNVKLAAPIRPSLSADDKGFRITPFIQFIWAGDTRSDINRACGRRVIDAFEAVGGVSVSFRF